MYTISLNRKTICTDLEPADFSWSAGWGDDGSGNNDGSSDSSSDASTADSGSSDA